VGPGLGFRVAEEPGQEVEWGPAADLLAKGVGGPGQADGVGVAVVPSGQVGQALEDRDDPDEAVDLADSSRASPMATWASAIRPARA
jgi:hypothetical protein